MPKLDRTVAVLGAGGTLGAAIVAGLAGCGLAAVGVDDDGLDGGRAIAQALRTAVPDGLGAVVDAGFFRGAPAVGELADTDVGTWLHDCELPLRRALHALQGAHTCLRRAGGRIIVLLPSVVMSGAAAVVPWAAAAEGYRSLAKAAARAWGSEGVIIKTVLVPAGLVTATGIERPGLQPPALGHTPDPYADIAPAVAALLDERLDAITGVTVAVDGGVWMTS